MMVMGMGGGGVEPGDFFLRGNFGRRCFLFWYVGAYGNKSRHKDPY